MSPISSKIKFRISSILGFLFFPCSAFFCTGGELILEYQTEEKNEKILKDSSGYYNDAELIKTGWVYDKDWNGNVLEFDGKASLLRAESVNGNTLEIWLKSPEISGEMGIIVHCAASWSGVWSNYRFALGMKDGRIAAIVGNNGASKSGFFYLTTKKTCNAGDWTCVTLTLDPNAICIYINGELDCKQEITPAFDPVKARFFSVGAQYNNHLAETIKASKQNPGAPEKKKWLENHPGKSFPETPCENFWKGRIGKIRIWEAPLNASEVKDCFKQYQK